MKKFIIKSTLVIVALSATQIFAGKEIATHVVKSEPGADVQSKVDDKGNVFILSATYSNGVVLTAPYKALNKKGKEYSSGNINEAVGANFVTFAGWVSFSKKIVVLSIVNGTETKWYSYKLSKKGATKMGELNAVNTGDTWQELLLWRNKIVVQTHKGTYLPAVPQTNKFEQYNIKLQKMSKNMEGSSNGGASIIGKACLFTTKTGTPPNEVTIYKLIKPGK